MHRSFRCPMGLISAGGRWVWVKGPPRLGRLFCIKASVTVLVVLQVATTGIWSMLIFMPNKNAWIVSLLLTFSITFSIGQNTTHMLINNSTDIEGLSFGEINELWWIWASNAPEEKDPVRDGTGKHCDYDQQGNIWFLAGTYSNGVKVVRECTIPFGKIVIGPLINIYSECNPKEKPEPLMPNPMTLSLEVDGVKYSHDSLLKQRAYLPCGKSNTNNEFVFDGYYYVLRSLTKGEHKLAIKASIRGFSQNIEYKLTVK